jgi:hypothetical protein
MGELNTFNQLIPVTKRDSEAGKTRKASARLDGIDRLLAEISKPKATRTATRVTRI